MRAEGWRSLEEELSAWAQEGSGPPTLWWRDDDATGPSEALDRLLGLVGDAEVPIALAVVPEPAEPALAQRLAAQASAPAAVLQHGVAHRNRAASGERSSEFPLGSEPAAALGAIAHGRDRLAELFGPQVHPVFVPPWNRIDVGVAAGLPGLGFRGLSTFGTHPKPPAVGELARIDAQVDIIDWRGTRSLVGTRAAIGRIVGDLAARRSGEVMRTRPTGLLTHHLVHDATIWSFLAELLQATRGRVRWLGVDAVLAVATPSGCRAHDPAG